MMDEFDKMVIQTADRIIDASNGLADAARTIKQGQAPVLPDDGRTFKFEVDEDGFLPAGQYLVTVYGHECRVAYRANSWDSWSPPHYQEQITN